ncbi:MAG: TetR/AcrR family transcriptional regulator [Rubrivivax sp.]|nr:TetR/AcrR family transcriptional regulator [Rubrivivax sp.]
MSAQPGPRQGYHHGDLRSALLDAGLRLLRARSVDDLSLRELAREVGVSAAAIYRHFPDKNALMAALAVEGLERLGQAQRRAMRAAGGGKAGFLASGMAYVRFAVDHPALFRLVYSAAQQCDPLDAQLDSVSSALRGLRQDIEALMPADAPPAERKAAALHAWALVHGLAQLMLDGQIPIDWRLVERVLSRVSLD